MMDIEGFRQRAKQADDEIAQLETTLKSLIQNKCKKYRYQVAYYGIKNRGNFARLIFEEAGVPFEDMNDSNKVLAYFKCNSKLSKDNENIKIDIFAPPAVIRYPLDPNSNEETIAISQTESMVSFLAQEFNLRPASLEENALAQMLIANANDILSEIFQHRDDSTEDVNKYYNGRLQIWLDILQKPLTIKQDQKYYFDDRCLAVDIAIYNICEGIIEIMGDRKKDLFIDTHPILYNHYKLIKNRKTIKTFIEKQNKQKYTWWPTGFGFEKCRNKLNGKESTDIIVDDDEKKKEEPKKQAVGGWKQAEKEEINQVANAVKAEVEKQGAAKNQAKFTKYDVISGTKQVVAGINYKIKVEVGDNRTAEILVYRSLPPFKYELKSVSFEGGGRPGGWKEAEKQELQEAANAVKTEVGRQADDEKFSCYEAISGNKQVVAGINYQIKVKIGENKFVEMRVYRSLPPFKYELKSVTFINERTDIPILGGWGKAAEKEEMTAAANSVKSEVERQASDIGKPIKCYDVEEGRKQVVAGMNYKIKIKIDTNRWCEIFVFRSLPPIVYELNSITWIQPSEQQPSEQQEAPLKVGGFKEGEKKELQDAVNAVKVDIVKQAIFDKKDKPLCYEVVSGTKQVVAGMNYDIKVKIGDNRYIDIKIYRSLPPFKYELKSVKW